MNWYFRPLEVDETTREPIQGEFFSTEAIRNPTEALVREGIQNSLDAGTESPAVAFVFALLRRDEKNPAPWRLCVERICVNGCLFVVYQPPKNFWISFTTSTNRSTSALVL